MSDLYVSVDWEEDCVRAESSRVEGRADAGPGVVARGGGSLSESFLLKNVVMGGKHGCVHCVVALARYRAELGGQLKRRELTDRWLRMLLHSKHGLKVVRKMVSSW